MLRNFLKLLAYILLTKKQIIKPKNKIIFCHFHKIIVKKQALTLFAFFNTYTGPLILAPQVCIVGIGRLMTVPRYDTKMNVVPRKIMNLSFGCDHRVLDGATVARFNNVWKTYLENPTSMFIHLK